MHIAQSINTCMKAFTKSFSICFILNGIEVYSGVTVFQMKVESNVFFFKANCKLNRLSTLISSHLFISFQTKLDVMSK